MQFQPKKIGLCLGPLFFGLILAFQPLTLKAGGNEVFAVAAWMITWWITEAVPLAVTALLPIVLLSTICGMKLDEVLVAYADKVLYLFLGGFLLALGLEAHNLHKRIALLIIQWVGFSAPRLILGFLLSSAFISMWISNTATAVMMLPMALSCLSLLGDTASANSFNPRQSRNFAVALMLAIAYGANIGGMATVIGTPPNLFMRSYFAKELQLEFSFLQWMLWAGPIVLALLVSAHLLLTRCFFPCRQLSFATAEAMFVRERCELGPMRPVHWRMLAVFGGTTFLWMTRTIIQPWMPMLPLTGQPLLLSDEVISLMGAIAIFIVPGAQPGRALLDWEATTRLPWGILLLFGGGIALANALEQTGVLQLLSNMVQQAAGGQPLLLIVLMTTLCVYLTEVMSNIALIQVLLPIICAIAVGVQGNQFQFAFPATLAASCAFMLPMATPPNGIVFGSGRITVREMMRAGFWMNIAALVIILPLSQLVIWLMPVI